MCYSQIKYIVVWKNWLLILCQTLPLIHKQMHSKQKGESGNRPVALRGHVTNASFKQWVGILLMPKIDRAHKNYLTPEIWEETHLRGIFYGTLIFQQSSTICIGRHVGGHTLALQHGGQTSFCLYLVKRLILTLRCAIIISSLNFCVSFSFVAVCKAF